MPGSIESTVEEIRAAGGAALGVRLDLLDRSSIDAPLEAALARYCRLDVLVNNAIYQVPAIVQSLADFSMEEAERAFLGLVVNQMETSRRAIEVMIPPGGGRIFFVTTLSSTMKATGASRLLYLAARAAFNKIPDYIQYEHGRDGILAFLDEPRFTMTDTMRARWGAGGDSMGQGRGARRPEDTAESVAWRVRPRDAARFAGGDMINAPDFFAVNGIDPEA